VLETREERHAKATPRSCKKLIRLTPAELARVNERARAAGQPVACFMRDAALGSRRKVTSAVLGTTLIRELARVATRLGGLRDAASSLALPQAAAFAEALDELVDLIRRID
jgi:hypothetical protein